MHAVPNPMASICGRVCGHPCETACRRKDFDSPISIRALKRFVTERYGPESRNPIEMYPARPGITRPDKVAVIGAGPAGLSAAHDLALLGYPVTIFEAASVPGGMLHLGIPEYRLPRDVVQAQVREILDLGPELKLNARGLASDFSLVRPSRTGIQSDPLRFRSSSQPRTLYPGQRFGRHYQGNRFSSERQSGVSVCHRQKSGRHWRRECRHRRCAVGHASQTGTGISDARSRYARPAYRKRTSRRHE